MAVKLAYRPLFSLPAAVQDPASAALPGGRFALLGGLDAADTSTANVTVADLRGPQRSASLPNAQHDAQAAAQNGQVYVFGGGQFSQYGHILRFDPVSGSVATAGSPPSAESDVAVAELGGTAYIVGGFDGTQPLDTIVAWTPGGRAQVVGHLPVAAPWTPDQLPEPHGRGSYDRGRARINGMPCARLNSYRAKRWASVVVLGAVVVTTARCSGHSPPRATSSRVPLEESSRFPLVSTDRGAVRGVISADGRVANFLGIAYAAPPVGALRWRPPQPAAAWTGVRAADHYGRVCAQPSSGDGPGSISEDCLYINVQRPALVDTRQRLPVYVYIHGGGLTTGDGSYFNMEKIVRETGVIGVTFNYRLGVFGFLSDPGLIAEQDQSGDYGFLDQQAALRWLRRNIAAFGGDPSHVTVGGESAGGWSVCAHLVSPASRGLFAQAMIQSGACQTETRDQANAVGTGFVANAGCPDSSPAKTVACLRALPAASLVHDEAELGFASLLVRGTRALPEDPHSAVLSGDFSHVPVLIGGTLDEGRAFTSSEIGWTQGDYEDWVHTLFGTNAGAVLAQYPWPANADQFTPAYLTGAILTDAGIIGPANPPIEAGIGGCGMQALIRDIARHTKVYAYEWSPRSGPGIVQSPDYANGAGHASELAYLWPNFTENGVRIASLFDPGERQLSDQIVKYWGAFVKAGAPRVAGQPSWPPYAATSAVRLSLRAQGQSRLLDNATISTEHHCSLWNKLSGN